MSLPSRFYNNMRHENNKIIVSSRKGFTFYTDLDNNNNKLQNPKIRESPWLFIACELFHRVVQLNPSHRDQEVLHEEHVLLSQFCSDAEMFATAELCRSSIENVLSRTPIPFDLDGHGDRLRWKDRVRMSFDETATVALRGGADVEDRVTAVAEKIAREVMSSARPVTSVEMKISFSKVTFVEAEAFGEIDENDSCMSFSDDDDDENVLILGNDLSGREWSSMDYDMYDDDVYNDVAMVEKKNNNDIIKNNFEKVVYGGGATEMRCAICRDEVDVGTHVALLTCGHSFHGDCIDPWLKKKATCPLCRFKLVE